MFQDSKTLVIACIGASGGACLWIVMALFVAFPKEIIDLKNEIFSIFVKNGEYTSIAMLVLFLVDALISAFFLRDQHMRRNYRGKGLVFLLICILFYLIFGLLVPVHLESTDKNKLILCGVLTLGALFAMRVQSYVVINRVDPVDRVDPVV